ncbi:hypothetical protein Tco_0780955 [Tanacetum coccineum]
MVAKTYDWDDEEVTFDDDEVVELKVLIALADDEKSTVRKDYAIMVGGTKSKAVGEISHLSQLHGGEANITTTTRLHLTQRRHQL